MSKNILINPSIGVQDEDLDDYSENKIFTKQEEWLDDEEGQLVLDLYQTKDDIVIKSTIAGVKPADLDISIQDDMLTIRGKREDEVKEEGRDYLCQECHWGNFSRSIILPAKVHADKISAVLKNGILTITLPKIKEFSSRNIKVKGE